MQQALRNILGIILHKMITSELLNEMMFVLTCYSDDWWKHVCKKGTANEYVNIYALKGHAKAMPLTFHDTDHNITLKITIIFLL